MKTVFVFGLGFSGRAFARRALAAGHSVCGSSRSAEAPNTSGARAFTIGDAQTAAALRSAIGEAQIAFVAAPPDASGDPTLADFGDALAASTRLERVIYLSTVGVYGGSEGAWIDESAPTAATSARARWRVAAEAQWLAFGRANGVAVDELRLAGIYGPGRNPLTKLAQGDSRRIVKPGQVFNRIHIEDIAGVALALIEAGAPGEVWNVADLEPAPPQDVITYAASLLGVDPPPEEPFDTADLTPMQRSFYASNQRISTEKLRRELGYRWRYPTFREGLSACLEAGDGRG